MLYAPLMAWGGWAGTVAVCLLISGCGPRTETGSSPATQSPPPTTLHQYVVDNKIAEARFRRGDPGTPTVKFASPPGWRNAGARTPDWAYGAIVYNTPKNPADPPFIIAITSTLSGDVDSAKVLEYAPGQLNRLPGFTPIVGPNRNSVSGFPAVDYAGMFDGHGERKAIGQVTIVVPGGGDKVFVFQLNAVAPSGEEQAVTDAVKRVVAETRISAPP